MIKGHHIILSINGVNVGLLKACTISSDVDMIEVSGPTAEGGCTHRASYGEWSIEAGTLVGNFDFLTMIGYVKSKSMLNIAFKTTSASSEQFSFTGTAFIKSLKMQAPIKRLATASISLQGSGKQTLTTNQTTQTND